MRYLLLSFIMFMIMLMFAANRLIALSELHYDVSTNLFNSNEIKSLNKKPAGQQGESDQTASIAEFKQNFKEVRRQEKLFQDRLKYQQRQQKQMLELSKRERRNRSNSSTSFESRLKDERQKQKLKALNDRIQRRQAINKRRLNQL